MTDGGGGCVSGWQRAALAEEYNRARENSPGAVRRHSQLVEEASEAAAGTPQVPVQPPWPQLLTMHARPAPQQEAQAGALAEASRISQASPSLRVQDWHSWLVEHSKVAGHSRSYWHDWRRPPARIRR